MFKSSIHARTLAVLALATTALVSLLGRPSRAAADEQAAGGPDAARLFEQLDVEGDGYLDADEIPAERRSLFERLLRKADTNQDGRLTSDEFAAGLGHARPSANAAPRSDESRPEKRDGKRPDDAPPVAKTPEAKTPEAKRPDPKAARAPGANFKRLDTNADGKLSADEVPEQGLKRFEKLVVRADADRDGAVSRAEFVQAFRDGKIGPNKQAKKPGKAPAAPAQAVAAQGGLFAAIDADGDGVLSAGEIEAAPAVLRKLDRDGDGTVTLREMAIAARKAAK